MCKREYVQRVIASILDHPSVYMGGPSRMNMKRAAKIIEVLEEDKFLDPDELAQEYEHV